LAEVAAQAAAAPAINPNAADVSDVEPDYKAAYLNNPRPPYPLLARRMGLQGRVVLDVEVLDIGLCGQVNVAQGSGYDVLDNAALNTVKSWHFAPARQAGRAVTRWFKVPINFSLKDNAA
jgi:protein TonB